MRNNLAQRLWSVVLLAVIQPSIAATPEYVYQFPKNMQVLAVPRNLHFKHDILSYEATYQLKGNTLTVKRTLDDRSPGPICTPAVSIEYQKMATILSKNTRAQVVYR